MPKKQLSRIPLVTVSRVAETTVPFGTVCNETFDAVKFWADNIATLPTFEPDKEQLFVILLNTKNRIIAFNLVSLGTVNESCAHPREILRPAIAMGAYGILLAHNHPSGDPYPSSADQRLTSRLLEACKLLMIPLCDHVIYGSRENFFSFRSAGLLC